MRALALVALLGACKIGDVHFIGLNGDDDANNGSGDGKLGDGQKMDGMANGHHAYLFEGDVSTGAGMIHLVMRDGNGALTLGGVLFTTPPIIGAVQDRTHTHLYALVASPPGIRTYAIATDGTITLQGGDVPLPTSCTTPARIIRSPDGNTLAIGCRQPSIITANFDANGAPTNVNFKQLQIGAQTAGLAFSPNSQCLFVVDQSNNNGLHMFNNQNGTLNEIAGSPTSAGPQARVVAVDNTGTFVFSANQNSIRAMPANGCSVAAATGTPLTLGQSPEFLFVDPNNLYVLAIGTAVDSFGWNGQVLTPTPGGPFLQNTPLVSGITFDPQLSALYMTSPGIPGVASSAVNAQGVLAGGVRYTFPQAPSSTWMELGP